MDFPLQVIVKHAEPVRDKGGHSMNNCEKIYWDSFCHNGQTLYAATTTQGLCCVTLPNESFDTLVKFVGRHFKNATFEQNQAALESCLTELKAYLNGTKNEFTVPLDLRGTSFQVAVWESLLKISHGKVTTYSDVAASIGKPSAVRAVGTAIGANPIPFIIPCHRVVGKGGGLTGYRGGLDLKSTLLQLEGARP
jgi:methylated-DNA-[protein]-cysteine S-methyltransferase